MLLESISGRSLEPDVKDNSYSSSAENNWKCVIFHKRKGAGDMFYEVCVLTSVVQSLLIIIFSNHLQVLVGSMVDMTYFVPMLLQTGTEIAF